MNPPKKEKAETKLPKVMVTPGVSPTFEQLKAAMKKDPEPVPETPEKDDAVEDVPNVTADETIEHPKKEGSENIVTIEGTNYEIKPTRVKYFRNKTATAYAPLSQIPLDELFMIPDGRLVPEKSSDEILFNFLIAAFDDDPVVKTHYDDMTAADINKIIEIFGRINGLDEKKEERQRKNAEAQAKP